ncbi:MULTISPECIES: hypothetical protein [Chryseobacterium]|jgi:hypothetical protein|uniref:hypothetical protein n=1 Tax=Chryseobacterium TaxID=59732 RepID=UPI0004932AFF|nr:MULTISPECIES: hypothetical protein [Chryseobacterium]MDR6156806.1 hypothetical protein [Chryseobacterium sp. SLBN-27]
MKNRFKQNEENPFIPNLQHMSKEEVLNIFEPYTRVLDNQDTLIFQLKKTWYGEKTLLYIFFNENKVEWYTKRFLLWYEKLSLYRL